MSNHFRSPEDYELFLYTITEQFPSVKHSSLAFIRRGISLARVAGELSFDNNIRLIIRERILYHCSPIIIDSYGYEVWEEKEKLYWYDSQPHPNEPSLMLTYPHHKHIPPDIRNNRIPAPKLSFISPNIVVLINEIEILINNK